MTTIMTVGNGRLHASGYGNQMNLYIPRLKAAGYEMVEFAFTDRMGKPVYRGEDNTLTLPARFDGWGNDVYAAHMQWTKADFSIGLYDFFIADANVFSKFPHCQIAAVDAEPLRPDLAKSLKDGARWVWAMSRFGERTMKAAGLDCTYVPHGVDMKVFHPLDRTEARGILQKHLDADEPEREYKVDLGDKFLVVMNAANVDSRKGFYEALAAWKIFHAAHPDSVLYMHTDMAGVRGENLFEHCATMGIDMVGNIAWPNQYFYHGGMLSGENLNDIYNAADVLLNCSYGEGFGIPIIEAQAAGCPVIVTDCSAMPELCRSGIKVPGIQTFARRAGLYWQHPSIPHMVAALEKFYTRARNISREKIAERVIEYDIDTVIANHMLPAVEAIETELHIEAMANKSDHTHKWAKVGLALSNGMGLQPCLVGKCEYGKRTDGVLQPHAFPARIGDIELDIEDDPEAGVSKVVMWEIENSYHLDRVDLRPGDAAVDIGAHVGIVSCYLAKRFPESLVVAYEPNLDNYQRLERNIFNNHVEDNALGHNKAVTGDGRPVVMPAGSDINTGGNNIYGPDLYKKIDSLSLETLLEVGKPALIKIDCEGAEYEILEGKTALLDGVRYVIGEFHTNKQWPKARAAALIAELKKVVPNVWVTLCPVPDLPEVAAGSNGHKHAEAVTA